MGWLLGILLGGVLTFNSAVTPDKAAQKAEAALERRFPGAQVEVEIEGKRGKDVLNGKFKRVHIEMANFTLTDLPFDALSVDGKLGHSDEVELVLKNVVWRNMTLEAAEFDLHDVGYDFGALKDSQLRFARLGSGTAKIDVQARSLGPVVESRLSNVFDANVEICDGQFFVWGKRRVLGLGAPFRLSATPEAAGTSIRLRDAHVSVAGVPVPGFVVGRLLGQVNPIYTFDGEPDWPFAVSFRQVDAQNDRLHIEADLSLKPEAVAAPGAATEPPF